VIGYPLVTVSVFIGIAVMLFAADLFAHKKKEAVSFKSSVMWSLIYIAGAMCFAAFLYFYHGQQAASLFLTGYTLEKVLAFDNLFVFSLIFAYFKIPAPDRHAALHWGIIGAIVFRLVFVVIGVESMSLFGPVMEFIFACLIAFTIYLIVKSGDDEADYDNVWYVKYIRRHFPSVTPFIIAICAIEISDIMFAFDSVPAVIAVTKDPLLIYSSMIFAILGLRSLYFVIDSLSSCLRYMDASIICVLSFISIKLAAHSITGFHIEANHSLIVVISILSVGIILSLFKGSDHEKEPNTEASSKAS